MDNTATYIKMCEKAEEIQELYRKSLNVRYTPGNAGYLVDSSFDYLYRHKLGDTPIWLPRQDQLQEMLGQYINEQGDIQYDIHTLIKLAFLGFKQWLDEQYHNEPFVCVPTNIFHSGEQLWLAFVMKEKYDKTWDGENWVK